MAGVTPLAQKTYSVTTPLAFWANCVRAKGLSLSMLLLLVYLAATTAHDPAAAPPPPETRVILAPRPRCAVVLDRHVQKSAGSTMRSIFLENALAGACL